MHRSAFARGLLFLLLLIPGFRVVAAAAADGASIKEVIVDPLGARVAGASVTLLQDNRTVKETKSGVDGEFSFDALPEGRYRVQAASEGFQPRTTSPMFVAAGAATTVEVSLSIGTLETDVTVTAAATPVLEAQIGASVTVLDSSTIENLGNTDLLEPLRTVPGAAVVQTGGRGGTTSLFEISWCV